MIKNFFSNLLHQDLEKQARQVEISTILVLIILVVVVGFLWQYKIELTLPVDEGRQVVARMNIFELLLSKR